MTQLVLTTHLPCFNMPINKFYKNKLKLIWRIICLAYSEFIPTYLTQRNKGYQKYGCYIENCDHSKYNWDKMALEEIVDALVYTNLK